VPPLNIGTAGWSIPRATADRFPAEGSALERYATGFGVAEINSSFHRPHRAATWQRWRETTPAPSASRLSFQGDHPQGQACRVRTELDDFSGASGAARSQLAVLLVQLPPSLAFDPLLAQAFFAHLVARTAASVVCEPRHLSWFEPQANELLVSHGIARVAADPAACEAAAHPGGSPRLAYWRLHGSPAMYRSSYADRIPMYASLLERSAGERETWCIFDNTASSAALSDALALQDLLTQAVSARR
jgi:uncharacterized protein YecE (DUF72 family)